MANILFPHAVPRGASRLPSRDEMERASRERQPYPSCRFHPDGRSQTVRTAEEDAALVEPWRDRPFPPEPKPDPAPVAPGATVASMAATLQTEREQSQRAYRALADQHEALQKQHRALGELLAGKDELIANLEEQLAAAASPEPAGKEAMPDLTSDTPRSARSPRKK